jgi:hypothetical protein
VATADSEAVTEVDSEEETEVEEVSIEVAEVAVEAEVVAAEVQVPLLEAASRSSRVKE